MTLCWLFLISMLISQHAHSNEIELQHYQAQQLVNDGQIISLQDALFNVSQFCAGKLLDAKLYQQEYDWYYDLQFKVQRGQLITLRINARNGQPAINTPLPNECIINNETVTR